MTSKPESEPDYFYIYIGTLERHIWLTLNGLTSVVNASKDENNTKYECHVNTYIEKHNAYSGEWATGHLKGWSIWVMCNNENESLTALSN